MAHLFMDIIKHLEHIQRHLVDHRINRLRIPLTDPEADELLEVANNQALWNYQFPGDYR